MRGVEVDLAELKGRVATLPTAWVMMTTMIGGQLTLAALVFAILKAFGPK